METKTETKYNEKLYNQLKEDGLIIFEVITGSQAYGTATPNSDIDKKFIYILPEDYILGNKYIPQIEVNKDYVGYEVKRFLDLIASNNPTLLELLYSPEDCIIHKNPVFDYILEYQKDFITKICADSFGGYARQQLSKSAGLDKKQNWEKERVARKEPIDFCYVIDGYKSYPIMKFIEVNGMDQKFCGVANIPNARDMYAFFYDWKAHNCFSDMVSQEEREYLKKYLKSKGETVGLGYKGIYKVGEGKNSGESNSLRLSSIPKGEECLVTFSYNKDGYTSHCNEHNDYQKWLEARNTQRWVDTKSHRQKDKSGSLIDGKNMMHCTRLINMAVEIAQGKGLIVRRPDSEELLKIRRGELSLEELTVNANEQIKKMDQLFKESSLPESVNKDLVHKILIKIRKSFYNKTK